MPQRDIIVPHVKVKDRAIFALEELYKALFRWFELHNYDFQEQEYRDDDMGGGRKHLELKWYAERKIDDYFKFVMEVNFLIVGLEDVEVEIEGVKHKSNKGDIEIRTRSYLLKDWQAKFEQTAMMKFLRDVYDKYIIRGRIEGYESDIYEETYKFLDEIKAFLNLHRFEYRN
ncbi:MAG: hypothetical protein AABW46_03610, partial [Nanoarchaeota archaeon]